MQLIARVEFEVNVDAQDKDSAYSIVTEELVDKIFLNFKLDTPTIIVRSIESHLKVIA